MERNRVEELDKEIKAVSYEIGELKKTNRLIEIDILKKKLEIEKIKLEQIKK